MQIHYVHKLTKIDSIKKEALFKSGCRETFRRLNFWDTLYIVRHVQIRARRPGLFLKKD